MNRREEILERTLKVPQMPMPVQRVMTLLSDPEADMGSLAKLIEYEPGLTVNVLRMANSAYFGGDGRILSVKDAVVRLGMRRVYQLVIASGVAPYTKQNLAGYGLKPGELLSHSVTVALASERLAAVLGLAAPPHTFTSGLLVNIGKIVLGAFLEVDAGPILELAHGEGLPFEQAERRILGIDHAELGAILLTRWEIPEPIVNVVRYRFRPDDSPIPDMALDLVHVGDVIAKMTGVGLGIDGLHYAPSEAVFERLGMREGVIEEVMEGILDHISELGGILGQ